MIGTLVIGYRSFPPGPGEEPAGGGADIAEGVTGEQDKPVLILLLPQSPGGEWWRKNLGLPDTIIAGRRGGKFQFDDIADTDRFQPPKIKIPVGADHPERTGGFQQTGAEKEVFRGIFPADQFIDTGGRNRQPGNGIAGTDDGGG